MIIEDIKKWFNKKFPTQYDKEGFYSSALEVIILIVILIFFSSIK